jgi:hypothetical protein
LTQQTKPLDDFYLDNFKAKKQIVDKLKLTQRKMIPVKTNICIPVIVSKHVTANLHTSKLYLTGYVR